MKLSINKIAASLCLTLVFVINSAFSPPAEKMVVIVNKNNPIGTLSNAEVKSYYLRKLKSRWPGSNKSIRPVDRKAKCREQEIFYAYILEMNTAEVEQYFTTRQLQNAERPTDKFQTEAEIIDFIATEPGAIGYVSAKAISPELKEKIKIVLEY